MRGNDLNNLKRTVIFPVELLARPFGLYISRVQLYLVTNFKTGSMGLMVIGVLFLLRLSLYYLFLKGFNNLIYLINEVVSFLAVYKFLSGCFVRPGFDWFDTHPGVLSYVCVKRSILNYLKEGIIYCKNS